AQLCDGGDIVEVCDRVLQWREGARPVPRPVERIALPRVLAEWERLLQGETNAMYRPQVPAPASARACTCPEPPKELVRRRSMRPSSPAAMKALMRVRAAMRTR